MKKILFIATGGTIASQEGTDGLIPVLTSKDLLYQVPELQSICSLDAIELFRLDSTNITPAEWLKLEQTIEARYDSYDGFVIAHGTDTMAYTAAALSYLIQNSAKPIVLTGSQKPINDRDTDARSNLIRAFQYAVSENAWGVHIVFYDRVICGTRAVKTYSKSFHAFASMNYPDTARFRENQLAAFLPKPELPAVRFYHALDTRVFVLKLIPGLQPDVLHAVLPQCRGLVLEGFGLGGLPDALLSELNAWTQNGGIVVFATQVRNEGTDLSVYEVGRLAGKLTGTVEAKDMTTEAAVTKLMWALSAGGSQKEICKLFEQPVAFDRL